MLTIEDLAPKSHVRHRVGLCSFLPPRSNMAGSDHLDVRSQNRRSEFSQPRCSELHVAVLRHPNLFMRGLESPGCRRFPTSDSRLARPTCSGSPGPSQEYSV